MLKAEQVSKAFHVGQMKRKEVPAVREVSLELCQGERLGLEGESGCGKSTLARMLACLLKPDAGIISFEGRDLSRMWGRERRNFRKEVQIIFQNPQQAFHPRMRLYETLAEPLRIYHLAENREMERQILEEQMETVGLTTDIFTRYPHEISGGQAQRIALLRSLMLKPKILIADEPTSMLDVSVQAQILKLIRQMTEKQGIGLLLISHDRAVIRAMCDSVLYMQEGRLKT